MPDRIFPATVISLLLICFSLSAKTQLATSGDYAVLVSPKTIVPGKTFRVLVASEKPNAKATLRAAGPSGSLAILGQQQGSGPPYWWTAEFKTEGDGTFRIWLEHARSRLAEKSFSVNTNKQDRDLSPFIWQAELSWTRLFENLYSAWIERLFLDKEEGHTWNFLHKVMQGTDSNILHNHFGLDEDDTLILEPDCADNPFLFRAYFPGSSAFPTGIISVTEALLKGLLDAVSGLPIMLPGKKGRMTSKLFKVLLEPSKILFIREAPVPDCPITTQISTHFLFNVRTCVLGRCSLILMDTP